MALLEALELSLEPRGWSMQRGHRKRLTTLRGDDRCIHRSTVKRSVASGRRVQVEEKNKSHKQQARRWQEIRSDLFDETLEDGDLWDFDTAVLEVQLEVQLEADCDSCSTISTAASTVEVVAKATTKAKATAWDQALEQAALGAQRFQRVAAEAKAERVAKQRAVKADPQVESLAQRLQQHRMKLLCPELASHPRDSFEAFRLKFLEDFCDSIGAGLQSCYLGEIELRCAPMNKNLQSRFLTCKEKQPEHLCPVLHGTDDRNLPSIYQKGLLVPTVQNNVRVLNGSSHGKGIYTAKTKNTALSFGFSKGMSRPLLICGALDDAVTLPSPVRCGNHFITAESASVRHVGDAIVVFDESKLLPLFVASSGMAPPLKPGPATAPAPAPVTASAPVTVAVPARASRDAEKCRKKGSGPISRPTITKTPLQLTLAFLSRRGARKRRP